MNLGESGRGARPPRKRTHRLSCQASPLDSFPPPKGTTGATRRRTLPTAMSGPKGRPSPRGRIGVDNVNGARTYLSNYLTLRIWEKKYGKAANHLKLREKEPRQPKRRAAEQRESFPPPDPVRNQRLWGGQSLPTSTSTFTPAPRSGPRKSAKPTPTSGATESVHPSWVAKQRAKEAQQAAAPQGKKITFD